MKIIAASIYKHTRNPSLSLPSDPVAVRIGANRWSHAVYDVVWQSESWVAINYQFGTLVRPRKDIR